MATLFYLVTAAFAMAAGLWMWRKPETDPFLLPSPRDRSPVYYWTRKGLALLLMGYAVLQIFFVLLPH